MERCVKCDFECVGIKKYGLIFCDVCIHFCPNDPEKADEYIQDMVDGEALEPFRKFSRSRGEQQKSGMIKKASKGKAMSRAPFGYHLEKGHLVPAQNFREVEEIFEEFLEDKATLNKVAKKHNLSVNGLKKILTNFTYIGKIKFNNQTFDGTHQSIVSPILFNKVQDKFDKIKKKR